MSDKKKLKYFFYIQFNKLLILLYINKMTLQNNFDLMILINICCKSKELERNKEETKREFRGNSDDLYFMLIKPIYRLIVRRLKAFT